MQLRFSPLCLLCRGVETLFRKGALYMPPLSVSMSGSSLGQAEYTVSFKQAFLTLECHFIYHYSQFNFLITASVV
jgi:hypothetical protein